MRIVIFIVCLAISPLGVFCQQSVFTVSGTVTASDGVPAPSVTVRLKENNRTSVTDVNGRYHFSSVPAGSYTLLVSMIGNKPEQKSIQVVNAAVQANISLESASSQLTEVIVSAGRVRETIDEVPSSVVILGSKTIEQNINITTNLGDILENRVSGLAPSTGLSSNFGQTLRGRSLLIMVDGIPQSTPLRNGAMDLRALDPSVIEKVEVVKGATAIYGNGAAGGLINYFTKNAKTDKVLNSLTSVGMTGSLVKSANSVGSRLSQTFYGDKNKLSYVASGVYEQTGELKDAKGDVLPPVYGLGETDSYNAFAKLGYEINARHRVQASYNFYSSRQTTNYLTVNGDYKNGVKTTAVQGQAKGVPQGVRGNHNLSLQFSGETGIANTHYDADIYYQSVDNIFFYSEAFVDGGISRILSKKNGARVVFNTPFVGRNMDANLTYGLDAQRDITSQPLVDGRIWVPEMDMFNLAPFLQTKFNLFSKLVLKGGVRYEKVSIGVSDYATLPSRNTTTGVVTPSMNVKGGTLRYNTWVFNAGARYHLSDYFQPYVSFSQGFSVSDVGLALRAARVNDIAKINTEAVIVSNYEAGFVSKFNKFRFEATGYISKSDLGANSVFQNGIFVVVRTPERITGFELSADMQVSKRLQAGVSYTYTEGKLDGDNDGSFNGKSDEYLPGQRIAPPKITGHADYAIIPGKLNVMLQYTGILRRDRFARNASGSYDPYKAPVNPYHLFNSVISYQANSSVSLNLGLENMFNADYFTARSQWGTFNDSYTKGKGAAYRLTLQVKL
ncbi:TonB-dependent receptor [Sediminibacterium soli]|uniref:TonB-dependent receptor n=1 Tax=Sediminibacterium soli TaxID=2698829 RepID=UPI00137B91E5|nr:TonB-dependent receptor [Sediminibacterium soli]NCI45059.1 TonB-dependent receptor [Sediminibacterium soli]